MPTYMYAQASMLLVHDVCLSISPAVLYSFDSYVQVVEICRMIRKLCVQGVLLVAFYLDTMARGWCCFPLGLNSKIYLKHETTFGFFAFSSGHFEGGASRGGGESYPQSFGA